MRSERGKGHGHSWVRAVLGSPWNRPLRSTAETIYFIIACYKYKLTKQLTQCTINEHTPDDTPISTTKFAQLPRFVSTYVNNEFSEFTEHVVSVVPNAEESKHLEDTSKPNCIT